MIGTLNQMASSQLKNICSHEVKKTYQQEKAAFESIIRSSGAATTLQVFESLPFEETGRFVRFTADGIVLQ